MKLHTDDAISGHGRNERIAINRMGDRVVLTRGLGGIRVHEVEAGVVREACHERMAASLQLRPTHMRDGNGSDGGLARQAADPAGNQTQTRALALFTALEQKVHAEADAENVCTRLVAVAERIGQSMLLEATHGMVERSDTGQDHLVSDGNYLGFPRHDRISANATAHVRNRSNIADAGIDDDELAHLRIETISISVPSPSTRAMALAGVPATTVRSGTSALTKLLAPMMHWLPIVTPGTTTHWGPT